LSCNFPPILRKIPRKYRTDIPFAILVVLTKNCHLKTAQHPTARSFALDFCADDAALLTQGKEDKEKYNQKNCCGAVGVRLPSA
jgi:hypothetical protein